MTMLCSRKRLTKRISRRLSALTGIPVARLGTGERAKLVHLEEILHEHVIGQDEAVKAVSEAVIRARAGTGRS